MTEAELLEALEWLRAAKACNEHGREYLVICKECLMTTGCKKCPGVLCYCTWDD